MTDVLLLAAVLLSAPFAQPVPQAAVAPPVPPVARAAQSEVIGRSVQGRPIRATVLGDRFAPVSILVVGCIHGNEPAGRAVVARLRRATPPDGVALWLIDRANPDGCLTDTRGNARGVDLNRNFPHRWRRLPRGTYYSGPRPLSEPESRALERFMGRERPDVSVWYHQHAELVDWYGDAGVARRYGRRVGLPAKIFYAAPGSITRWQHEVLGATGLVVELPAGSLPAASGRRHAAAVLALAREAR